MRLIEINEAEAIFEPFWEGGTSEHTNPHNKYRVLDEYQIEYSSNTISRIEQAWAFIAINIDKADKNKVASSISRNCNLDTSIYDTFKIFASFPEELLIDVYVTIDGTYEKIGHRIKGHGVTGEYDLPIKGDLITSIKIDFIPTADYIAGNIGWLGLSDSKRVKYMENRKKYYDKDWIGLFKKKDSVSLDVEIGILFGQEELNEVRTKFKKEPFKRAYEDMKKVAQEYMTIDPEPFIGTYVAKTDRRWCRNRDMDKPEMHEIMEKLSFVGLIEKDYEMLKMGCRYALSAAHCTYWCESIMGVFSGAIWHHRSFTEEIYCKSTAYVLDWAGSLLTPYGKQILRDAITMKGLPRLEADFKCIDYIRAMNQGIVFSGGRVTGLLALVDRFPRYYSNIIEAEQDIIEMINNYIKEDGGTLEGPHYWQYTFSNILPILYMLARYQNKPLSTYTELLAKTGNFILAHLSQQDDGTIILPINDAHPGVHLNSNIAYSFYELTKDEIWLKIYSKLLNKGYVSNDIFTLVVSPDIDILDTQIEEKSYFFNTTGQIDIHRKGENLNKVHFHYCSGELYVGHSHQDKGSFILEAEGKTLCPDCGTGYYHDANLKTLCNVNNHNLFIPIYDNGKLAHQPMACFGGKILKSNLEEDYLTIISDETDAWEKGLVKSCHRKVISPCAEVYLIIDKVELYEAHHMNFLLNSYAPYEDKGDSRFTADFNTCSLNIVPLNWTTKSSNIRKFEDGEHDEVYQLEMTTEKSNSHFKVTAILLDMNCPFKVTELDKGQYYITNNHYKTLITIKENTVEVIECSNENI